MASFKYKICNMNLEDKRPLEYYKKRTRRKSKVSEYGDPEFLKYHFLL